MSVSLQDQVAVVVGASSGMGRAIAKALAQQGARVMAAARREDRLNELQTEAAAEGLMIDVCPTDVTSREEVERLIATTVETLGRIDLLVYATGTNIPDRSLKELTSETWEMMLATNLTGAFHCTQVVLPTMRSAQAGLIIYLSTGAVQSPDVSGVAYQSSKHGLTGLAHGTRVEEKASGIRTSIIFPGLCETEIIHKRPVPTPREVLDQALQPDDDAESVLFVAQLDPRAVVPELQLLPSRL
jgi:NADP-dependent 3-hydroxy acid dehydrogenase YdfG